TRTHDIEQPWRYIVGCLRRVEAVSGPPPRRIINDQGTCGRAFLHRISLDAHKHRQIVTSFSSHIGPRLAKDSALPLPGGPGILVAAPNKNAGGDWPCLAVGNAPQANR